MTRLLSTSRTLLALGVSLATIGTAQAQSGSQLEEVVVTAERREASLQQTDISMTVLGESTIKELGIDNFSQIGDFAPNVKMHEVPNSSGAVTSIRGFRNGETIATFEPKVGLYLDGVIIAKNAGSAFDILELERIEVLRGPQGTLYGRNTAGGAINLVTKKPVDEFEGKVAGTLGDYDQRDLRVMLNVPLLGPEGVLGQGGDSRLDLRANFGDLNRDEYFKNINPDVGGRNWDKDRQVAHVQLRWQPNDAISFLYAYDNSDIDENSPAPTLAAAFSPTYAPFVHDGGKTRNFEFEQFRETDIEGHSLTVDWQLNENMSLVSVTSQRDLEEQSSQDADGTPVFVISTLAANETDTFTQELRLVGAAMDSRLEYVVGGFYMDEEIPLARSANVIGPGLGAPAVGVYQDRYASAQNDIWAVFGEATYSLTQKLDFTLGLRYTEEDREMDVFLSTGLGGLSPTPQLSVSAGPKKFDDVSGTVGFSYQWNDDVMTYLKVSNGYVSGGFNARADIPADDVDEAQRLFEKGYDEENVYTYELGWKTTWFDNRLVVNGAIFYSDYEDLQVNIFENNLNNLSNAGDADIQGFEVEVLANPIDNLQIGAGYGYLDPQYNTFIDDKDTEDPSDDVDLSEILNWAHSPENTFNTWIRYEVPDFLTIGNLVTRVDYSWTDEYYLLSSGQLVDDYDLINARITLDSIEGIGSGNLSLSLWGKNLGDEVYYMSGYPIVGEHRYTGAPRTWGVDVSYEF